MLIFKTAASDLNRTITNKQRLEFYTLPAISKYKQLSNEKADNRIITLRVIGSASVRLAL